MEPGLLIGNALTVLTTGLTAVAGPALAVGASVLALTVGWQFAKKFVKG